MPYLKRKMIRGNEYYYLAHNYRIGGKVKTKTLEYLGTQPPSPELLARLKDKYSNPGTQLTLVLELQPVISQTAQPAQLPES